MSKIILKVRQKFLWSDVRCVCSITLENQPPFTEVWIYRAKLGIDRSWVSDSASGRDWQGILGKLRTSVLKLMAK